MRGLVVAGTSGEWFILAAEEKRARFQAAGEVLVGVMPLIAGCKAFTAEDVIRNAEMSVNAGFDGIPVTPLPYIRPCERGIFAFYEDGSVGTPLSGCVYTWPPEVDIVQHTLETTGYL